MRFWGREWFDIFWKVREHVGSQFAKAKTLLCDRQLFRHRDDTASPILIRAADRGSLRASVIVTSLQGIGTLRSLSPERSPSWDDPVLIEHCHCC
jgi:hypothetical protein